MEKLKNITSNIVLALQVLIVFVLIFESSIEVPQVLQAFGRMHPLLLHLPIGLIFVVTALVFFDKPLQASPGVITFFLLLLAITCSATALMGLFLSKEGGYDNGVLQFHKWLGVILSFITWGMIFLAGGKGLRWTLISSCILLTFAGHLGATLTHGENFVSAPLFVEEPKPRVLSDSSTLFSAVIEPIFETKCYGCHNRQKSKGQLVLTSLSSILKGGKNGSLWKPHSAANSLLVKRIHLPLEAKEHMPPKDKAQLSPDEIDFIASWIDAGADTRLLLSSLPETDTLNILAKGIVARYYTEPDDRRRYAFDFAPEERIRELNIPNRAVFQIARNEPALAADFFLRDSYNGKYLEQLHQVSEQIISLNLSNMPVEDDDLKLISRFQNLEKLILNNTKINGSGFKDLTALRNLRSISLAGTAVEKGSLDMLAKIPELKTVYIWNTRLDRLEINRLQQQYRHIGWDAGYLPNDKELLKLNPPLVQNESQVLDRDERIVLKHNLRGTEIRYTIDGTEPDSIRSLVYEKPIHITGYTVVKTRAFKNGWAGSDTAEHVFYKKGQVPSSAELLTSSEPKYEGEGAVTFIDGIKGMPDFYRDPSWIGFRNKPLVAHFTFDQSRPISKITISYGRNIWAMCMPPESVEVWGGPDERHLQLLGKVVPKQPDTWVSSRFEGVEVEIPSSDFAFYKIVAKPLARLPAFRNAKKEKGWLMVDEIFFN